MSSIKSELAMNHPSQHYLEFDLDGETMAVVEELAEKEGVSPFEMCVILMHESLSTSPTAAPGK